MKNLLTACLVALLITAATSALALGPLDANAELGLYSKYVWRGMITTTDPVLQPDVSFSALGFSLGVWGNIDTSDVNGNEWRFNEIDYILSYSLPLPLLDLGAGFIHYSFPNTDVNSTTEFYLSAEVNVILSPRLAIYQDLDEIKGAYWEAGVGHGFELGPSLDLDLGASLGLGSEAYMNGYYGVIPDLTVPGGVSAFTGATLSNYLVTAALPYHPVPFVTITASAAYSGLLGDAKDSHDLKGINTETVFFGLSAGIGF